jgi:hypothetical protein
MPLSFFHFDEALNVYSFCTLLCFAFSGEDLGKERKSVYLQQILTSKFILFIGHVFVHGVLLSYFIDLRQPGLFITCRRSETEVHISIRIYAVGPVWSNRIFQSDKDKILIPEMGAAGIECFNDDR